MEKNNVLCIMAHPDDAFVWCGGLILNFLKSDIPVNIVSFSNFEDNKKYALNMKKISQEKGFTFYSFDKNATNFVSKIYELIIQVNPSLIITHWRYDTHDTHRRVSQLAEKAIKQHKFYMFDHDRIRDIKMLQCDTYYSVGIDGIPFPGKILIDISGVFEEKIEILEKICGKYYQLIKSMISIQNKFYGGKAGCEYAESFLESSSLASIGGGIGKTNIYGLIDLSKQTENKKIMRKK